MFDTPAVAGSASSDFLSLLADVGFGTVGTAPPASPQDEGDAEQREGPKRERSIGDAQETGPWFLFVNVTPPPEPVRFPINLDLVIAPPTSVNESCDAAAQAAAAPPAGTLAPSMARQVLLAGTPIEGAPEFVTERQREIVLDIAFEAPAAPVETEPAQLVEGNTASKPATPRGAGVTGAAQQGTTKTTPAPQSETAVEAPPPRESATVKATLARSGSSAERLPKPELARAEGSNTGTSNQDSSEQRGSRPKQDRRDGPEIDRTAAVETRIAAHPPAPASAPAYTSPAAEPAAMGPALRPPLDEPTPAPQRLQAPAPANGAKPAPIREIAIQLPGTDSRTIGLHILENRGKVHVEVRTDDVQLASSLRDHVSELVQKLDNSGYRTAVSEITDVREHKMTTEKEQPHGDKGGSQQNPQQQQQHGHPRGNRPRWLEEIRKNFLTNAPRQEDNEDGVN